MASRPSTASSKEHISKAFREVTDQHRAQMTRIVTAEEAAERGQEREVVKTASGYTVEVIIKGLADLQLGFGSTIDGVVACLSGEGSKLEELRRAIEIETAYAGHLGDVSVAADALDVLTQEHKEALRAHDEQAKAMVLALSTETQSTRAAWEEQRAQHERDVARFDERQGKDRAKAEADFDYELARKRKVDADGLADKRAQAELQIAEQDQQRSKQWAEREAALAAKGAEHAAHKARVEAFAQEMEDAARKARDEALRETFADAKVKAELLEKEVEGNRKVYALQVESLEATLAKQGEQIASLTSRLQVALTQVQELAHKAIDGTSARGS
jgi:hypothetical protein